MTILRIWVLLGCLIVLTAGSVSAEPPSVQCPVIKPADAPKIDGKLKDAAWKSAPVSPNFTDNTGTIPGKPASKYRAMTDGKFLYIAIELADPDVSKLPKKNLGRDQLGWSECVEVFFAPFADKPEYYHFGVDPAGNDADCKGLGNAPDFNTSWKHKELVGPKGWITEIALPLTELGRVQSVKQGDMLGFNVCRSTRGVVPLQCWSPTFGGFNNRAAFGTLVVGGYTAAAALRVKTLSGRIQELKSRSASMPAIKDRLDGVLASFTELQRKSKKILSLRDWNAFTTGCVKLDRVMSITSLAGRDLMIWSINPWDLPWSDTLPSSDTKSVDTITINAFQGEYITRAVAITNATDDTVVFRCIPTDLVTPTWTKKAPAAKHLRLFEAQEAGLRGGAKQRDPLPELPIDRVVNLSPGRNSVVWMTIDATDLEPGQWASTITIKPNYQVSLLKRLRVVVNVLPAAFPKGPEPYSCNWAMYTSPPCSSYPEACFEDQKQHMTSVHTVPWGSTGFTTVKLGPDGKPANEPDFTELDKFISTFGTNGQVYILSSEYSYWPYEWGGGGSWTQATYDNFAWWVKKARKHLEEKGVPVSNFAWYPHDEPCTETDAMLVSNFGKLLRLADPEQKIFTTVYSAVTMKALEIMAPYVDIWVPSMWLTVEQRDFVKKQNARFFSYSVLGRESSPYWSYRMDGWRAIQYGYEGIGFWDYNDCGTTPGSSVWDDNDGDRSDYAVIYEGADKPVTSVRWEAWRQGIQDYRMIKWLESLAAASPDGAKAKALLSEALTSATKGNNTGADIYFEKMRDEAVKLMVASGKVPASATSISGPLVCLTGNGGDSVENIDTGGYYTYSIYPDIKWYGEHCGLMEGSVYFKGKNAKTGLQSENHFDGLLTDGLLGYPINYVIFNYPPAVISTTFDLHRSYKLSHLLAYVDSIGASVSISSTGKDGSWQQVSSVPTITTGPKSYDGAALLDLGGRRARYIKLELQTDKNTVRFGECRIFGWK